MKTLNSILNPQQVEYIRFLKTFQEFSLKYSQTKVENNINRSTKMWIANLKSYRQLIKRSVIKNITITQFQDIRTLIRSLRHPNDK